MLTFPAVLWKVVADTRDFVKRWEPILDVWQEPAAAPNAWVGLSVWGFLGFSRNSHFLLRRTVICCVCSSGFFGFSWSLVDSAVTDELSGLATTKQSLFNVMHPVVFLLVLFHCGLHSKETRRHRTCYFWLVASLLKPWPKLDMGHDNQLASKCISIFFYYILLYCNICIQIYIL